MLALVAAAGVESEPETESVAVTEDRLVAAEGKLGGLEEQFLEAKATLDKLAKIHLGGYAQGRFEWHQDAYPGLKPDGKPAETTMFLVRRARLKATVDAQWTQFVLQIDATGKGVALKDAEATFIEPWTPLHLRLTAGQFKWPFGYEVVQSSGDREMPERSRVVRALFPGERDRGLRVQGRWEWLRFSAALVNGNGTEDAVYGVNDQNGWKDLVGRVGADFGYVAFGFSGWGGGESLKTTAATATAPAAFDRFGPLRVGADVQGYVDVPMLGGLALKGEVIFARDEHLGFGAAPRDPAKDVNALGWSALAVQNIGDFVAAIARLDDYDPNLAKAGDRVFTAAGGLLVHIGGNLKLATVLEWPVSEGTDPGDAAVTAQLQAKF